MYFQKDYYKVKNNEINGQNLFKIQVLFIGYNCIKNHFKKNEKILINN